MKLPNDIPPDALPELERWAAMLQPAYARESVRTRLSHVAAFLRWLRAGGLSLPADGPALAAYLAARGDLKPSSLRRHIAAIGLFHRDLGHPDPARTRPVELTLMAARRHRGTPRRQAAPIDPATIAAIAAAADASRLARRDATMLLAAGETGLRRSEMVALDVGDFARDREGYGTLWVRRSKTDVARLGAPAHLSRRAAEAVSDWIGDAGLGMGPLFPRLGRSGHPCGRLRPERVTECYRRAARAAGLPAGICDSLTSHSPRVGLAQDLLARGMSATRVAQQARWRDGRMPLLYAELAPAHLSAAPVSGR